MKIPFIPEEMITEEIVHLGQETLFLVPNWKWAALGSVLVAFVLVYPVLAFALRHFLVFLQERRSNKKDYLSYFFKRPLSKPLSGVLLTVIFFITLNALGLGGNLEKYLTNLNIIFLYFCLLRIAYNAVDAAGSILSDYSSTTDSKMDDMLVPYISKTLKVLVIILGTLMLLQNIGIHVVSILAGLGLGGLALALAAQDTAANIFGSITIFLDQPFRIGDFIKVQEVEGTVEGIGFRSTQIRTSYNSLVSIPNSIVAKEKIDNLGVRPSRRVRHILGVTYDTPAEKLEEFCNNLRYVIAQEEKVDKERIQVAFHGYGDSSLNILVNFHLNVGTLEDELIYQQKVLLDILALSKQMQVDFAFPTRTLFVQNNHSNGVL